MKGEMSDQSSAGSAAATVRAAWMRVLALAGAEALDAAWARLHGQGDVPAYRFLRKPESGMAMVRARAGGTGAQFNLGETTVTRCAVVLEADGIAGVSYVQGAAAAMRNRRPCSTRCCSRRTGMPACRMP